MVARSLLARLGRLETEISSKGRGLIIVLDNAKSVGETRAALSQENIDPDDASNLIVNIRRIGFRTDRPAKLIYAKPMAKGAL